MKILLLSRYGRMGASSRLRSYQYLPVFKRHGIKINVAPLFDDAYLKNLYAGRKKRIMPIACRIFSRLLKLMTRQRYDLLWIENELFPWLPSWAEQWLAASGIKYMVDYDDAIFHRYDMLKSRVPKKILGHKIDRIMQGAALVIAGNDYIADRAEKAGAKKVEILPTVVDLDHYPLDSPPRSDKFTIGWIGSPVTAPYLYPATPALGTLCRQNNAQLVTIGAGPVHMDHVRITDHRWSEDTEVARISEFDAGIMPLPDDPWTRGKCGYKLIQYMACAKPVVASAVGANLQIVDHGKNGFLVETQEQWTHALTLLADNPDLREKMGRQGRKKVETQYCLQKTAPKFITLLNQCLSN